MGFAAVAAVGGIGGGDMLMLNHFFSGLGICSCGKFPYNSKIWKDYASSEENGKDRLCIQLNQHFKRIMSR